MNDAVSCRALIPILMFAIKHGIDIDQLTSGIIERHYIENPRNWVSWSLAIELFQRCEQIFNDPLIMYKIGSEGWNHQKGAYAAFTRLLLRPPLAVRFMPKINAMHVKFFKMRAKLVQKNQIKFQMDYDDNQMAHRHGCLFNLGMFRSWPEFVWKAKGVIVEHQCACKRELASIENLHEKPEMIRNIKFGSDSCVYVLDFKKIKSDRQTAVFFDSNQELIENTLNELYKAESDVPVKLAKTNPEYFNSQLSEMKFISPREKEIIKLVAQGMKNKEIAQKLFISQETVKKHLNNIFRKMGVKTRYELISKIYNYKN